MDAKGVEGPGVVEGEEEEDTKVSFWAVTLKAFYYVSYSIKKNIYEYLILSVCSHLQFGSIS